MRGDMRRALVLLAAALAVVACDTAARDEDAPEGAVPAEAATADSVRAAESGQAELVDAATRIIAFLRGEAAFDAARFADTVTLYVAPAGGGETRRYARNELRNPGAWVVGTRVLMPFAGPARLTTRAGRHFNCHEHALDTRYEDLAAMPHVGTKLEPPASSSCLQSWNLTLVFAPAPGPPVLVAAVYDQWEW